MAMNNSLQKSLLEVLLNVTDEEEGSAALMSDITATNVIVSALTQTISVEVTEKAAKLVCKLMQRRGNLPI
jgi:hypothetical protein